MINNKSLTQNIYTIAASPPKLLRAIFSSAGFYPAFSEVIKASARIMQYYFSSPQIPAAQHPQLKCNETYLSCSKLHARAHRKTPAIFHSAIHAFHLSLLFRNWATLPECLV